MAGYGNLTPSTDLGKLVTMLYALVGIPLMFIYMANIGTVLASSFKFLYSKVCRCEAKPDLPTSASLPAMSREDTISLRQACQVATKLQIILSLNLLKSL